MSAHRCWLRQKVRCWWHARHDLFVNPHLLCDKHRRELMEPSRARESFEETP